MKKLSLLLLSAAIVACAADDLEVAPDGSDLQVAEIITETETETDEVFHIVEDMPSFPGGQEAYYKYLGSNIEYPKQARELGIEGRVFITFVVNKDGSLSDLQLARGIGGGCDEEALRVFMESPNWVPGKQRGKVVKTRMQAAVTFELGEKGDAMLEIQEPSKAKTPQIREIAPPPPPIEEVLDDTDIDQENN